MQTEGAPRRVNTDLCCVGGFRRFCRSLCDDYDLVGGFNIDLLKSENHVPTGEFVSSLYSHILFPLIYRPTRLLNVN